MLRTDGPLCLHLCSLTLSEQERAERAERAEVTRLALLPATQTSTVTKPNVPSKGGQIGVQMERGKTSN